jgi:predicted transcriptional regulator
MAASIELFMELLPASRAAIAKKLIEYGLSQKEAGERLGVTQPAISHYKRNLRGHKTSLSGDSRISAGIEELARKLVSGEITAHEVTTELFAVFKEAPEHQ